MVHPYTARPADQIILPINTSPGTVMSPTILNTWRDAVEDAIVAGQMQDDFGNTVPLAQPEDIDTLGNSLEATSLSVSTNNYGNLHNMGHGFIAGSPAPTANSPDGVMGYPWVSAMDPVFWRWHRMIDDIGAKFQDSMPAQDFSDAPAGIILRNQDVLVLVLVLRAEDVPGFDAHDATTLAQWVDSEFGGCNWDTDFTGHLPTTGRLHTFSATADITLERSQNPVTLTYGDYEDFALVIRMENTSADDRRATVRVWLCLGEDINLGRSCIELDTFEHALAASSRSVIYRSARESSVARKQNGLGSRPPKLETAAGDFDRDNLDDDYCECGWPYTLLLPRGTEAEEEDGFVEAVIKSRGEGEKKDAGMEELLELLMQRLEDSGSLRPDDYNVFPMMQRAVIRAKKSYIRKLIDQSEVVAAMANRRKE